MHRYDDDGTSSAGLVPMGHPVTDAAFVFFLMAVSSPTLRAFLIQITPTTRCFKPAVIACVEKKKKNCALLPFHLFFLIRKKTWVRSVGEKSGAFFFFFKDFSSLAPGLVCTATIPHNTTHGHDVVSELGRSGLSKTRPYTPARPLPQISILN